MQISHITQTSYPQPTCQEEDLYDLDIELKATSEPKLESAIISKFLCTPGCGQTGTFNSFCC